MRLKPGDIAVLFGAGTGYTWAATAVKWGKSTRNEAAFVTGEG